MNFPLKDLLRQADESGSRSTALKIPAWLAGMLLTTLLGSAVGPLGVPVWISILLAVLLVAVLGFIGWAFHSCVKTNQWDPLRSETYALTRLAIEKGYVGDSLSGLRDPRDITPAQQQVESEPLKLGDSR